MLRAAESVARAAVDGVVMAAIAVAVMILTLGGPQLVRRIHRWQRQREEYAARRQAAQYIQKATVILDRELVETTYRRIGASLSDTELYWAVVTHIQRSEGRNPSIGRSRAINQHCLAIVAATHNGHAPRAS